MSDVSSQDKGENSFNVAVVGKTGAGKSSLINTYFRFQPGSEEAARDNPEGPIPYHVTDSKVTLWDTAGFGSMTMPEGDDFFKKVNFSSYDFYLIVSSNRINEFEGEIRERIHQQGKAYLYVRTKMNQTLKSEQKAHPKTFTQDQTLTQIRDKITEAFPGATVFLVDTRDPEALDFPALKEELLKASLLPRPPSRPSGSSTRGDVGPEGEGSFVIVQEGGTGQGDGHDDNYEDSDDERRGRAVAERRWWLYELIVGFWSRCTIL